MSASRILGKTALLEFRTQKENTSSQLKNLQLQRFKLNDLIEQFKIGDKRNEEKSLLLMDNLNKIEK